MLEFIGFLVAAEEVKNENNIVDQQVTNDDIKIMKTIRQGIIDFVDQNNGSTFESIIKEFRDKRGFAPMVILNAFYDLRDSGDLIRKELKGAKLVSFHLPA